MKNNSYPSLILFIIAVFVSGLALYVLLPPVEPPEPVYTTLIWHTSPDLMHSSGKYRVMIYNERNEYIGFVHLTRSEMGKPVKIIVDYRFTEFKAGYNDHE